MTSWLERSAAQVLAEAFQSGATFNETFWQNDTFDTLLADASSTLDAQQRRQLYAEMQQLLRDEGGALIPFHLNQVRIIAVNVQGVDPINQFAIPWHKVSLAAD